MKTIFIQSLVGMLRYKDAANPTPDEIARRQRFLARYPGQEANVLSFQTQPGCQCVGSITQAIMQDPQGANAAATAIMGEEYTIITPKDMAGETVDIDNDPAAWKAFIKRSRDEIWSYRGMNVVPTNGWLRVFFY